MREVEFHRRIRLSQEGFPTGCVAQGHGRGGDIQIGAQQQPHRSAGYLESIPITVKAEAAGPFLFIRGQRFG